ncbi:helix-turn-helix domain-containing protein [Paenibacillus turpanensis]|uniref:helix-turn-helix domain-containing protein n=1 Tax=Paenibacillus turpanensis TaxID=2689078 RepID=UPI0014085010|nr:helix-turn-helix transcriptional regulator [Paenibacillus turpanensis]
MKTCGERISELREAQSLTQEELAKQLNISRASLSHYEKNRREPDYETLDKIANYFKVSVDYLIGRTDESNSSVQSNVKLFEESLELSDESILERFALKVDGRELTAEEAKRFIAFVRAERAMK